MKKIFVNGTFDVVHVGHLKLLEFAKSLGTHLLVMIDSDERVKKLKGTSRPINTEYERVTLLKSLKWVDEVCVFNSDEELDRGIQAYSPDIMVKGSDYAGKPIIGASHCKSIIFYDRINDYSSTKKIQDIVNR